MEYRAFCYLQNGTREVPHDAPILIAAAQVYSELLGGLTDDGDFFGIVDPEGTTLQIAYEAAGHLYWVEIPRPDLGGSYGAMLSFDAVADLLTSLPALFPREGFQTFQFRSWA